MARRLLAFALAFVVIGAPFAGNVCEAACAEHAGHSIDPALRASHHHHPDSQPSHYLHSAALRAPATQSAAFKPLPRPCGHLEAVVTESRELTRAPIVKAVVTLARMAPLIVHVLPTSEMDSRHGPPAPIRSASTLRI